MLESPIVNVYLMIIGTLGTNVEGPHILYDLVPEVFMKLGPATT